MCLQKKKKCNNIQLLPKGKALYRYNLVIPPHNWTTGYKNPQYGGTKYGPKNQAGFFFFYGSCDTALKVGQKAIDIEKKRGKTYNYFGITSCVLTKDVQVLDLSMGDSGDYFPEYLLDILDSCEIDVLTNSYKNFVKELPFSTIKKDYRFIKKAKITGSALDWRNEYGMRVNSFFDGNGSILGQSLSDLSNGILFAKELRKRNLDGYLFTEEMDDCSICLCDSSFLSQPTHHTTCF